MNDSTITRQLSSDTLIEENFINDKIDFQSNKVNNMERKKKSKRKVTSKNIYRLNEVVKNGVKYFGHESRASNGSVTASFICPKCDELFTCVIRDIVTERLTMCKDCRKLERDSKSNGSN